MSIVSAVGQMMRGASPGSPGPVPGESVMYGGGEFLEAGAEPRGHAFTSPLLPDASELDLFPWNPDCGGDGGGVGSVETMILSGADMYLGGGFTLVDGEFRNHAACVDSNPTQANPTLRPWNPDCNSTVYTMILSGADMYLGGAFTKIGVEERNRAACVDSDTTQANPTLRNWNPNCSSHVFTMLLDGADMYLGGHFTLVGVETRNRAACVDSDTTQASPTLRNWNPNCDGGGRTVETMLLDGADMYLGGDFTTVSGNTRNCAACVDSDPNSAATLRNWNPNCDWTVETMLLNEEDMYLGGRFFTVRGETRMRAACVDSDSSQANPTLRNWNPNCSSHVFTMLLDGADMYLGGAFSTVSLSDRLRAAAVASDPATNVLRDYSLALNNTYDPAFSAVKVFASSEGISSS